jgi:hypothetical protein
MKSLWHVATHIDSAVQHNGWIAWNSSHLPATIPPLCSRKTALSKRQREHVEPTLMRDFSLKELLIPTGNISPAVVLQAVDA